FIDWDDNEYVVHNKDISGFSIENISAWFSHFYVGNYHPLTIFSYTIDNFIGGGQPFIYHFTNIFLHTCTAITLYFFINRLQENKTIGLFVALLFALHPSQTESVSWIAERKTTLCAFFYFLALLRYTTYLKKMSVKNLAIVFLFGMGAMLSKGVGVVLPLSLLAVDIWTQRDLKSKRVWIEKIPFLMGSIVIGIAAIKGQESAKLLGMHDEYNRFDTLILAAYAYIQYIIHLFVPVKLSFFYPYPKTIGFVQYLYFVLSAGIIALAFISYRKKWYILWGSIVFYTVNIVLLLQFIQFGEALMADRYLYIACIGIIFPAIYYLFAWLQKMSKQFIAIIASSCIGLVFLFMTFIHNDTWLSDFNFFNAILDTYPNSATAQYSVGGLYMRLGEYGEAEKHINLAVQLEPNNYKAWYNKGVLCLRERKLTESLDALNKCLSIKEYPKAYFSRALIYQGAGQPEQAIADIEKVIDDQPQNARAFFIKAECLEQQGKITDAIDNYNKAILYDDKDPLFYIRRGMIYGKTRQNEAALNDLNRAVGLRPGNGEALYFRGIIKYHTGQNPCDDFREALNCGYKQAQEALAKACH
ncbi:MAG: tetratricopeptide repeat protein, partial [Chitinophagales bacterium]